MLQLFGVSVFLGALLLVIGLFAMSNPPPVVRQARLLALLPLLLGIICLIPLHQINEGHVGVIYRFRALSLKILQPGLNWVLPIVDVVSQIQVTQQTDAITDVPCGTKDGVPLVFPRIEVVNQLNASEVYNVVSQFGVDYDQPLIFARIHHEMNQYCSHSVLNDVYIDKFDQLDDHLTETLQRSINQYVQGLRIHAVRLTKPILPPELAANFKAIVSGNMEVVAMRTRQEKEMALIMSENNRTLAHVEANRTRAMAMLTADLQKEVERIRIGRELQEAQINTTHLHDLSRIRTIQEQEMSKTEANRLCRLAEIAALNEITIASARANITAQEGVMAVRKLELHIRVMEMEVAHKGALQYAEAQKMLYTPAYAAVELSRNMANNAKIYWGDKLPVFGLNAMAQVLGTSSGTDPDPVV